MVGPSRTLFNVGLATAQHELNRQVAHCKYGDDAEFSLWRCKVQTENDVAISFMNHCNQMKGTTLLGRVYKVRENSQMCIYGLYVPNVGSLVMYSWSGGNFSIDFYPWKDRFFNISFRDDLISICAPASIWSKAYCADKIAYSNDSITNLPTFSLQGREYINTGMFWGNSSYECSALTFRPLNAWNAATYTYSTITNAWDKGHVERGDQRGLLVLVRGIKCVIDGEVRIYDDNPNKQVIYADSFIDDEETENEGSLDFDMAE